MTNILLSVFHKKEWPTYKKKPCARKGKILFKKKKKRKKKTTKNNKKTTTTNHSDSTKKFSETDVINMLKFFIANIFAKNETLRHLRAAPAYGVYISHLS
jgi:hypothetical protein